MTMQNTHTKYDEYLEPGEIVTKYYKALYSGDLKSVKALMTEESYFMALEPFGLKLSFKDPDFNVTWEQIEKSQDALHEVEKKISTELISRDLSPRIVIKETETNGSQRSIVHYGKDGKKKKLSFSKEDGYWRINYFAGRPVKPGYFDSIKNWVKSIMPTFK